ncbi:MAG: aldo/keto reductase [Clostridia bacterium]|nr:aldo/keto reductase [Clostridia bacterium]
MEYREFKGKKLPALGFGTMRLPVENGKVDQAAVGEMVDYAIANGVNYFDTAWGYHSGESEVAVGKALSAYPRESYFLADKFPGYDLSTFGRKEEVWETQLSRTGAGYFDFYMFHNVCELNIEQYLDPKYGIYDFLMAKKAEGKIVHLGFSAHGSVENMKRFLDAYGKDMEFCQIQLNWLDWEFQSAREKVELLNEWNIPVWVMEPLRGGNLMKLSGDQAERIAGIRPGCGPVELAFRFIQSVPEAVVTLSGMSDMAQMRENIAIFEKHAPLNDGELASLAAVAHELTTRDSVPCTACRYCTDHCPQGIDIPWLIELYNEHKFSGGGFLAPMAISSLPEEKKPSGCLGCESCEAVCPQQIKIASVMKDFAEIL